MSFLIHHCYRYLFFAIIFLGLGSYDAHSYELLEPMCSLMKEEKSRVENYLKREFGLDKAKEDTFLTILNHEKNTKLKREFLDLFKTRAKILSDLNFPINTAFIGAEENEQAEANNTLSQMDRKKAGIFRIGSRATELFEQMQANAGRGKLIANFPKEGQGSLLTATGDTSNPQQMIRFMNPLNAEYLQDLIEDLPALKESYAHKLSMLTKLYPTVRFPRMSATDIDTNEVALVFINEDGNDVLDLEDLLALDTEKFLAACEIANEPKDDILTEIDFSRKQNFIPLNKADKAGFGVAGDGSQTKQDAL